MEALIDDAASRVKHVTFNSQVLEIHQHLAMCRRRGRALRGRDRTLAAVRARLQGSAARPDLPPRPLVLHGQAGCGKTSVIAKVRWTRPSKDCSYIINLISSYLTSSDLISSELHVCVVIGCSHGELSCAVERPSSPWPRLITAHSVQMKWGQMRWDEMRWWYERSLIPQLCVRLHSQLRSICWYQFLLHGEQRHMCEWCVDMVYGNHGMAWVWTRNCQF